MKKFKVNDKVIYEGKETEIVAFTNETEYHEYTILVNEDMGHSGDTFSDRDVSQYKGRCWYVPESMLTEVPKVTEGTPEFIQHNGRTYTLVEEISKINVRTFTVGGDYAMANEEVLEENLVLIGQDVNTKVYRDILCNRIVFKVEEQQ